MKESPSSAWFICFFREIFIYIFLPFSLSVFSSEVEVLFSWLPAKSCAFLGVKKPYWYSAGRAEIALCGIPTGFLQVTEGQNMPEISRFSLGSTCNCLTLQNGLLLHATKILRLWPVFSPYAITTRFTNVRQLQVNDRSLLAWNE